MKKTICIFVVLVVSAQVFAQEHSSKSDLEKCSFTEKRHNPVSGGNRQKVFKKISKFFSDQVSRVKDGIQRISKLDSILEARYGETEEEKNLNHPRKGSYEDESREAFEVTVYKPAEKETSVILDTLRYKYVAKGIMGRYFEDENRDEVFFDYLPSEKELIEIAQVLETGHLEDDDGDDIPLITENTDNEWTKWFYKIYATKEGSWVLKRTDPDGIMIRELTGKIQKSVSLHDQVMNIEIKYWTIIVYYPYARLVLRDTVFFAKLK